MSQSHDELAQIARLNSYYGFARSPAVQSVTNKVCDCGHIGLSNATRSEADKIISTLGLDADANLLDLGAGAGWPGLYFAKLTGCHVTLLDMPEDGLKLAAERAIEDGISKRVKTVRADASSMPFANRVFSTITHSDVLCCLSPKKRVLEECRRVIDGNGKMAFSVIEVAPGLSASDQADALDAGPDFVHSDEPYRDLLDDTGWRISSCLDRTADLEQTYVKMIRAERASEADLRNIAGDEFYEEGQAGWAKKLSAVRRGLLLRFLYFLAPA